MARPITRTAREPDASSASAPLRVAVIGVGRIGRMHAELLAARVPGVALAAVCDAAPDAARAVADQLGVDVAVVSMTFSEPRTSTLSRSARARPPMPT